jgi:hypothetical protein
MMLTVTAMLLLISKARGIALMPVNDRRLKQLQESCSASCAISGYELIQAHGLAMRL